jgi:hypothetical protein
MWYLGGRYEEPPQDRGQRRDAALAGAVFTFHSKMDVALCIESIITKLTAVRE